MAPVQPGAIAQKTTGATLVVAVGQFTNPLHEVEDELPAASAESWPDLAFAQKHCQDVAEKLTRLRDPRPVLLVHPTMRDLRDGIRSAVENWRAPETIVVHVLSHGFTRRSGGLCVAAADSDRRPTSSWDVDRFLEDLEDSQSPLTMLLCLDVCHAGAAASIAWLQRVSQQRRKVFVIAACPAEDQAYAGRFSRAVTHVLNEVASGAADLSPAERYVSMPWMVNRVYRCLLALCEEARVAPQEVVSTPTHGREDLGFFPNPWFREDAVARYEARRQQGLGDFLDTVDPVLDFPHFLGRVLGGGPNYRLDAGCHFAGRTAELEQLTNWVDGESDEQLPLVVVTGSPGSGKSALLGVIVCCTHPALAQVTQAVRDRIPANCRPSPARYVAAVHARKQTLSTLLRSLGPLCQTRMRHQGRMRSL